MSRPRSRLIITLFMLALGVAPARAQVGPSGSPNRAQLHGQVRFAQGGAPAFNILVRLERFDGGVVDQQYTDRNGRFIFSGLRPLTYNVSIHTAGYEDVQQQVELVTKNSDYIIFTLKADSSSAGASSTTPAVVLDVKVPLAARKEYEKGCAAILEEKRLADGIASLEKAVNLYPNFLEAHLMLGTAYMDARQLDKAEVALRRALSVDPKAAPALVALGEVYRQQKRYAEAEKVLRAGLNLDNRLWQGHYTLGRVYLALGDIVKAGPQIGLTIQLKPDVAEAHLLAGNILLRAHKPDDALTEFEQYLRLAPKGEYAGQAQELVKKIKRALADKKQ
jgi:tetratricopeptide (TPR) repeat protein